MRTRAAGRNSIRPPNGGGGPRLELTVISPPTDGDIATRRELRTTLLPHNRPLILSNNTRLWGRSGRRPVRGDQTSPQTPSPVTGPAHHGPAHHGTIARESAGAIPGPTRFAHQHHPVIDPIGACCQRHHRCARDKSGSVASRARERRSHHPERGPVFRDASRNDRIPVSFARSIMPSRPHRVYHLAVTGFPDNSGPFSRPLFELGDAETIPSGRRVRRSVVRRSKPGSRSSKPNVFRYANPQFAPHVPVDIRQPEIRP